MPEFLVEYTVLSVRFTRVTAASQYEAATMVKEGHEQTDYTEDKEAVLIIRVEEDE